MMDSERNSDSFHEHSTFLSCAACGKVYKNSQEIIIQPGKMLYFACV